MRFFAALTLTLALTGCGGVVLSSDGARGNSDPAFLNYGLPRAYIPITIKREKPKEPGAGVVLTVSMDKKEIVYARDPDPKYNYRLVQHHAWYTNDSLIVQTDGAGLLTAINATSENQLAAITNQSLVLANQVTAIKFTEGSECKAKPFSVTYVLDPLNPGDVKKLNDLLETDACAKIKVSPLETVSDGLGACNNCTEGNGVFYRLARTYKIDIADTTGETRGMSALFTAPDVEHTYFMPMERKWFVKFDVKLAFEKGVLTRFESSKPSQALAALQLPGDIIKNILGLSTSSSASTVSKGK